MANTRVTLMLAILCFTILNFELHAHSEGPGAVERIEYCRSACNYRCSKASRHKMCLRACNTCCQRCNCVPPGTSGNEDVCPCYANMTTHNGRHKCP